MLLNLMVRMKPFTANGSLNANIITKTCPYMNFHIFNKILTMKKIVTFVFSLFFLCASGNDYLVSYEKISSFNNSQMHFFLDYYSVPTGEKEIYGVDVYKLTYVTTDVKGEPSVASGAVFIPIINECSYLPLISWQHGTIFDKTEVPSQGKGNSLIGAMLSAFGNIVTYPDYLGLGDNEGIHPYHHGDSQATAAMDLIRATREFMKDQVSFQDNNQLFIAGYSQGGHATMALHKFIQDRDLYGEFNIVASAPMSGAYDMAGAQFDLIFDGDSTYYMSPFIPYLLGSYQLVYEDIYQSYNEIYKAPYAEEIKKYVTGSYTADEWINLIPDNYYKFIQDSVITNILADKDRDSHPILRAMKLNSYTDWIPERPVKMLYSGLDSMVSPQNAINTLNQMVALGAENVEAVNVFPEGVHENSLILQLIYAMDWFESLIKPCQLITSVDNPIKNKTFSIYPNPAENILNIDYQGDLKIEIFNILGEKIMKGEKNSEGTIDISGLKAGKYIIVGREPKKSNYITSQFIVL